MRDFIFSTNRPPLLKKETIGNHLVSSKIEEGVSPYKRVQKDSYRLVEKDPLVDRPVKGQLL
jgi:hypothetical protein